MWNSSESLSGISGTIDHPPPPPYNGRKLCGDAATSVARSSTPRFVRRYFARSAAKAPGIIICKILISPRPLTTPRSVLFTMPGEKCAELICRLIDCGQVNEGTTPRPRFIGSNCYPARSCLPLRFRACFLLMVVVFDLKSFGEVILGFGGVAIL